MRKDRSLRCRALAPLCSPPLSLALLAACGPAAGPVETVRAPVVYTTFYPTSWLAERIAGDALEVVCPVPDGEDPAFWQPPRAVLARYQRADLILLNGADFERWTGQASLPPSRVVDCSESFRDRLLVRARATHAHGPSGAHTHEGTDGHTWLDPRNAAEMARAIERAFSARLPERAAKFRADLAALEADLDELHARFEALAPKLRSALLVASHPSYDYLAARYGWKVVNLDLEPGAPLSDASRAEIAAAIDGAARALLLWETEPLAATADALRAELGVESVLFSPCELRTAEQRAAGLDYLALMHANLDRLAAALSR